METGDPDYHSGAVALGQHREPQILCDRRRREWRDLGGFRPGLFPCRTAPIAKPAPAQANSSSSSACNRSTGKRATPTSPRRRCSTPSSGARSPGELHLTPTCSIRREALGWHVCPAASATSPAPLLSLPTWCYTRDATTLCVNLYAGGQVNVGAFGGTPVKVEQVTDYPWRGGVQLALHPARPARFTLSRSACRTGSRARCTGSRPPPARSQDSRSTAGPSPPNGAGYLTLTRTRREGDRLRVRTAFARAAHSTPRPSCRRSPAGSRCAAVRCSTTLKASIRTSVGAGAGRAVVGGVEGRPAR